MRKSTLCILNCSGDLKLSGMWLIYWSIEVYDWAIWDSNVTDWNFNPCTRLRPLYTNRWHHPGLDIGRTVPFTKPKQLLSGAPLLKITSLSSSIALNTFWFQSLIRCLWLSYTQSITLLFIFVIQISFQISGSCRSSDMGMQIASERYKGLRFHHILFLDHIWT